MLDWLNGSNLPNRLYVCLVNGTARNAPEGQRVTLPTAFTLCPDDNTLLAPNAWLERVFGNIVRRHDADGADIFSPSNNPTFLSLSCAQPSPPIAQVEASAMDRGWCNPRSRRGTAIDDELLPGNIGRGIRCKE